MASKMIVMSEMEFRTMVQDEVYGCSNEGREDLATVLELLRNLFFWLCEVHEVQGLIVWRGRNGCRPTELMWLDDARKFVQSALSEL